MTSTEEAKDKKREAARQAFYRVHVEEALRRQHAAIFADDACEKEVSLKTISSTMMAEMSPEQLMDFIKVIVVGGVVPAEFSERGPNQDTGLDILRQACAGMLTTAARVYPYSPLPKEANDEPS